MQLELSDIVKLFNRIEALEQKVAALESHIEKHDDHQKIDFVRPPFPTGKISEKYKRLAEYLYENWERKIELDYTQIEDILGFHLPLTAYKLPQQYWANTQTHTYSSSWLAIGYKAKVIGEKSVAFTRDLYQGE